jgi:hypothetical protein
MKCVFQLSSTNCFGDVHEQSGRKYGYRQPIFLCFGNSHSKIIKKCCWPFGCTSGSKLGNLPRKLEPVLDRQSSTITTGFICWKHKGQYDKNPSLFAENPQVIQTQSDFNSTQSTSVSATPTSSDASTQTASVEAGQSTTFETSASLSDSGFLEESMHYEPR